MGFIMSKNVRGCVLNFQLEYKFTNLLVFWHNETQKERVSTESINYLIRPVFNQICMYQPAKFLLWVESIQFIINSYYTTSNFTSHCLSSWTIESVYFLMNEGKYTKMSKFHLHVYFRKKVAWIQAPIFRLRITQNKKLNQNSKAFAKNSIQSQTRKAVPVDETESEKQ